MPEQLSVPGNILLLGEYSVLASGGLGLAVAPDIRVRLQFEPAETFDLTCRWGGKEVVWQPGIGSDQPLLSAVWQRCSARLKRYGTDIDTLRGRIRIDSSEFYYGNGRKSGIGSSAAVSVALANAAMLQSGLNTELAFSEALRASLEGHRLAQGGSGSGYDVYTSSYGGIGLFIGGPRPIWKPLDLPWLPPLYLFPGLHRVSSANAIVKYQSWKEDHPQAAAELLKDSNAAVLAFVRAGSWTAAKSSFDRCRELALHLGSSIGVPAEVAPPAALQSFACKAVGAGNELGLALGGAGVQMLPDSPFKAITISTGGVQWTE